MYTHFMSKFHSSQPKRDMIPTMDTLKEYLGLIQEFPDTVDIHRGAVSKVKDCERMKEEGRIDVSVDPYKYKTTCSCACTIIRRTENFSCESNIQIFVNYMHVFNYSFTCV